MKNKTFVIIDGNAIIHRAYHAIPPLSTKEGVMVNAVYGFTSMMIKVINDIKPDYMAVAFDMAGGTFRDKIFTEYKAKRVKADQDLYDQIPLIHEMVTAFGIPIFEREGFEADDVIGTIVKKIGTQEVDIKSVIVSGDMDLLQLVTRDEIVVRGFKKGLSEMVTFDEAAVKEKYGFGPELVVDYKALRGDASDNIPGVPGIGEKTATLLLQKIGGIEQIYTEINKESSEITAEFTKSVIEKLKKGESSARMSFEIATIHTEVPDLHFSVQACILPAFNHERLLPLFQRFGFVSLLKRLGAEETAENNTKHSVVAPKNTATIKIVGPGDSELLVARIKKEKKWIAKEIVSGTSVLVADWIGFVVYFPEQSWQVDWKELTKTDQNFWQELLGDTNVTFIGHDIKQLLKAFFQADVSVKNMLFDTMIASYVLNSGTRAHDLKSIALRELAEELADTAQGNLFGPDVAQIVRELSVVSRTYQMYVAALEKNNEKEVFGQIEMALIPVLAKMELYGVALDTHLLQSLSQSAQKQIEKISKDIWREAGEEFNIASSVQLRDILYEKMNLKIPGIKKGKTGYSTAASELEKLRGTSPIIELIEDFRELTKLQNTYLDVLPTLVSPKTGRLHTSYNQAVAATGRLSSSDPNLQNIPIRTELGRQVRNAFIAEPGNILVVADYSQFELRIVASLAGDEKLIEIFNKGEDVHKATAAIVNNVPLADVSPEMRRAAKEVNFGVLYGMGVFGLSSRTGISQAEAKDFITKYFEQFSGVKKYLEDTVAFATQEGYVETMFGRRRYIPEIQSDNRQVRNAGERMAVNMPVQGTQADLIKMAMINLQKDLEKKYAATEVKMILQVHDELVFEVKSGLEAELIPLIKEKMSGVIKLKVPIEVSVGTGKNWGVAK